MIGFLSHYIRGMFPFGIGLLDQGWLSNFLFILSYSYNEIAKRWHSSLERMACMCFITWFLDFLGRRRSRTRARRPLWRRSRTRIEEPSAEPPASWPELRRLNKKRKHIFQVFCVFLISFNYLTYFLNKWKILIFKI